MWTAEIDASDRFAFLVTPGGQRVARMSKARAKGIAAALNTEQGTEAFNKARNEPCHTPPQLLP